METLLEALLHLTNLFEVRPMLIKGRYTIN